jgi:hypothetical protein
MSDLPADSPALASQTQGEGWTRNKFIFLIAFALALHVALIFIFGTKKQIVPRAVTEVPHLQLADSASELITLGDPTLFARPNAHDFVTAFWQRPQLVRQPDFHWTEAPRYLLPAPEKFGAAFREFMQTNPPPAMPLNFKPEPKLIEPVTAFDDAMPQATTLQISGELSQRRRLNQIELPSISVNDVIAPSVVQALVDTAGNVASTVLLPDNGIEAAAHYDLADQLALQLARNLRFAPAPRLMFGEIIFNWHTVPLTATNAP